MYPHIGKHQSAIGSGAVLGGASQMNLLYAVGSIWGLMALAAFLIVWMEGAFASEKGNSYLLPWCLIVGIVLTAPIIYQFYRGTFDPFHPIVFASWSYFLPGFFLGGLALAFGYSQPFYLTYVIDERFNLPLTFAYVLIGFLSLMLGFSLTWARKAGQKIAAHLPEWNWTPEQIIKPALVLLAIGTANTFLGFVYGFLGYQVTEDIGTYDGIIFLLSLLWLQASFLLWLAIFRAPQFGISHLLIIVALVATSFTKSALQGNRGSLISLFILITFAYASSGKKIGPKQTAVGAVLVTIALIAGMIYGTTFRSVKETQAALQIDQYASVVGNTVAAISEQDLSSNLEKGFVAVAERLDSVSPLAVIVANYEQLAPYEESYGLANNIWTESITFLIPRILWTDKPVATDAAKYGDLYYNYPDNSFTMTPMGDLLRNFGPIGVPLGMIFLGVFLRLLYSSLKEGQPFSFWRAGLFFMLLTSVSYEGSFGLIIPYAFKVGFIAVMGILLIRFLVGSGKQKASGRILKTRI
jgi:hypothetical protein